MIDSTLLYPFYVVLQIHESTSPVKCSWRRSDTQDYRGFALISTLYYAYQARAAAAKASRWSIPILVFLIYPHSKMKSSYILIYSLDSKGHLWPTSALFWMVHVFILWTLLRRWFSSVTTIIWHKYPYHSSGQWRRPICDSLTYSNFLTTPRILELSASTLRLTWDPPPGNTLNVPFLPQPPL
jgi:hypothetical protein